MDGPARPSSHQTARGLIRTVFIVAAMAYAILTNGMDIALPWHPFSSFGLTASANAIVTSVDPAAAHAGLRVGDRIDVSRLSPAQRLNVISYFTAAPEGKAIALPIASSRGDRYVRLTSHVRLRSLADNLTDVISVLALAIYALIAGAFVLLRPLPATWAFFGFSFAFFESPTLFTEYASPVILALEDTILAMASSITSVFFVWFALRFPNNVFSGTSKTVERVLLFVWAPALAILAASGVALVAAGRGSTQVFWIESFVSIPLFFAGIWILIWRYARADTQNRNRLRWIVASFAVAFLPVLIVINVENSPIFSILPPLWIINLAYAGVGSSIIAAVKHGREGWGCDLVHDYVEIGWERIHALLAGTLRVREMGKPVYDPTLPYGGHKA